MFGYLELEPHPALRRWVRCYWWLRRVSTAPTLVEPILPDGSVEVVFHRGDECHRCHDDGWLELEPRTLLVSELQRPIRLQPGKTLDCVGIRFRPGGARRFFTAPATELAGSLLDLSLIWPSAQETLARLAELEVPFAVAAVLDRVLFEHQRPDLGDERVDLLLDELRRTRGVVSISSLAADSGISIRHLERLLTPAIGIPPKRLARVLRFHHAFAALLEGETDRALDGYSDHSHLLRDFREFAAAPPSTLLGHELELNRHFARGGRDT